MNSQVIFSAVGVLSATPLMHSLRSDGGDFALFGFSKSEDAEAFATRVGSGCLRVGDNPETKRDDAKAAPRPPAEVVGAPANPNVGVSFGIDVRYHFGIGVVCHSWSRFIIKTAMDRRFCRLL
jgi:hypothetical protein